MNVSMYIILRYDVKGYVFWVCTFRRLQLTGGRPARPHGLSCLGLQLQHSQLTQPNHLSSQLSIKEVLSIQSCLFCIEFYQFSDFCYNSNFFRKITLENVHIFNVRYIRFEGNDGKLSKIRFY